MTENTRRPLALIILDGWGASPERERNAVALAHTPCYDEICQQFPATTLSVDPASLGLAPGERCNAEIGHRTIGAGRLVRSDAAIVAAAVSTGEILRNEVLHSALASAAAGRKTAHFIGMLGDGGVHSSHETLFSLLRMARAAGLKEAFVHGILDGRDVRPRTADVYVDALEIKMADIGIGRIASLCGRFYAMDDSDHWERTARAYTMLVHGEGEGAAEAVAAVQASFLRGISDEFVSPIVIEHAPGQPVATVKEGDLVIFFNHRADGMRQLARSLAAPDPGSPKPNVDVVCLTEYEPALDLPVAFRQSRGLGALSATLEAHRIKSFRITETSRSAHVSTFIDGGSGFDPDLQRRAYFKTDASEALESGPESKSFKIADAVIKGLDSGDGGVFVVNLPAPATMAATGNLEKTIESVQFVDTCLGGVIDKLSEINGIALVTSSHTGVERIEEGSTPSRSETRAVPFHLIDPASPNGGLMSGGSLADVAPTILGILGIEQPPEMTGRDLRII